MHVLLITDRDDFESSVPALRLFAHSVRQISLCAGSTAKPNRPHRADVALVDARTDLPAARQACRHLTAWEPSTAVVAVIAAEDLVAVDLDWHVDDVLLTTASTTELYARLRWASARRRHAVEDSVQFGDLTLHPGTYTASLANRELNLTLTEFKLLNYLVRHAGRAVPRSTLIDEVWGHQRQRRTVNVHVQRLRAKLGAGHESIIDTVRGVGYMAPADSQPHPTIDSARTA